ncbi:MAG: hypothetical protein WCP12_12235, partial [bacterium]
IAQSLKNSASTLRVRASAAWAYRRLACTSKFSRIDWSGSRRTREQAGTLLRQGYGAAGAYSPSLSAPVNRPLNRLYTKVQQD